MLKVASVCFTTSVAQLLRSSQRAQQSVHNAAYSATFASRLCDQLQVKRAGWYRYSKLHCLFCHRWHTSSARMLSGQDSNDLSRIASKYPCSYLQPLSFFVSWQGVLTLAYKYGACWLPKELPDLASIPDLGKSPGSHVSMLYAVQRLFTSTSRPQARTQQQTP